MKSKVIKYRELSIRCKAFSNEPVRLNRVLVQSDGLVSVWDSVAGYFTACHSLSQRTMEKIRRMVQF